MNHVTKLIPFVRPYWKRAVASLVLLVAVVIMDLAIPRLVQRIIDQGILQNNLPVVLQTTLVMLTISLLSTFFAIGNNILSIQVGEGVARDLRETMFLHIQSFSFGNLDRLRTGQLMVRLSSDTSVVQRLVQVSLRIGTRAPLLMIGSLALMFNTDRQLALTMTPLLLVTSGIIALFVSKMSPLYRAVQQKLDWLNTVLQENIAGVRVVKAFVQADHEGERFVEANQAFTDHTIRVMQYVSTLSPALSMFVGLGVVLVVWAGGLQAIAGYLSLGQIVAFVSYLQTTLGPLMIMVMLSNVLAAGTASAERVSEVLETVPEVQDAPNALVLPELTMAKVTFENAAFHYNGAADAEILKNINLVAEPRQTVAILGATGAGKSTLINLIPRFYNPCAGKILINGIDISQVEQDSLLAQVGIVPQETILFSGTVRDNIRYGHPDASHEEVVAVAQAAQAHDFILALPQGYDTHIEERGVNLSGGQKQRIAIARALLTRPAILLLDDSTSSVDVETEAKIQDALSTWMQNSTCFVVAQRVSTVLNADKIIIIDQGHIVGAGTHAQLMQSSPIYQEIYASQLGEGINLEQML
ncbi:MAG: ABC transporter ATP-binding protein [Anaerolineales bacterium]|nr:ABC transporter ATP-binding protein [Anaerolineales bacterium]